MLHEFVYQDAQQATMTSSPDRPGFIFSCLATEPKFSGTAPWTITVEESTSTTATATFDPITDVLVASPVFVHYVVEKGKTCVPNCQSPWTGEPNATTVPYGPANDGPQFANLGIGAIVGIVIGTMVGSVLLCLFIWYICTSGKRGRL